jgi:hypothetical protein
MRVRNKVIVSARMLATTPAMYFEALDGRRNKPAWERDIWLIEAESDPLKREIDNAVRQIEAICRSILDTKPIWSPWDGWALAEAPCSALARAHPLKRLCRSSNAIRARLAALQ